MNQRAIWLGLLTACGLLTILLGGLILIPHLLYPALTPADLRGVASAQARVQLQQAQSLLANDARSAVLQGFAGLLVVVGVTATWWQVHVSRESQITERFTRAVDQLGSQNADVRIGAFTLSSASPRTLPPTATPFNSSWAPLCAITRPGLSALLTARSTPPRPWTTTCHGCACVGPIFRQQWAFWPAACRRGTSKSFTSPE